MARAFGTPKSLILTRLAVGARALRANRFAHESREWVRCGRETIGGDAPCWGMVGLRKYHLDSLVEHKLHAGTPMRSTTPILPEQGGRAHRERMQQQTHPAGLCRLVAMSLTLLGACGHVRQSTILAA